MTPPEADVILARRAGAIGERRRCVEAAREASRAYREMRTAVAMQIGTALNDLADRLERGPLP